MATRVYTFVQSHHLDWAFGCVIYTYIIFIYLRKQYKHIRNHLCIHDLEKHGTCKNCMFVQKTKNDILECFMSMITSNFYNVHGILQAKILKWVAFLFSRWSSQPRDRTQVSCIAGRFFTFWATREAQALSLSPL